MLAGRDLLTSIIDAPWQERGASGARKLAAYAIPWVSVCSAVAHGLLILAGALHANALQAAKTSGYS